MEEDCGGDQGLRWAVESRGGGIERERLLTTTQQCSVTVKVVKERRI
jgi:hypothetical protein